MPSRNRSTVVLGGARSGKSTLAQRLVATWAGSVTVLVTAEPIDEEMASRIDAHRRHRPPAWRTVEAPYELGAALAAVPPDHVVLVDCVTVWLGNLVVRGDDDTRVEAVVDELVAAITGRTAAPTVVVSNEVGTGIVPPDPSSRRFRDLHGWLNQRLVAELDRAVLVVAGRVCRLEPPELMLPELILPEAT